MSEVSGTTGLDEFAHDIAAHIADVHHRRRGGGGGPGAGDRGLRAARAAVPAARWPGRCSAPCATSSRTTGSSRTPATDPDADPLRETLAALLEGVDDYAVGVRPAGAGPPGARPDLRRPRQRRHRPGPRPAAPHRRPAGRGAVVVAVLVPGQLGRPRAERPAGAAVDRRPPAAGRRRRSPPRPPRRTRCYATDPETPVSASGRPAAPSRRPVSCPFRPRILVEEARAVALVVQKYGGSSVADADEHQAGRPTDRRDHAGRATTSSSSSPRWATPPTSCIDLAEQVSPAPAGARARHAAHRRRAHLDGRCWRWRSPTSASRRARSPARQAGVITDSVARQGPDHRRHPGPDPARARRGRDRDRRRLPGRQRRTPRTSPRSAAAAPTPPPSRWPPRWTPTSARSTPTSTASSPPTRGSCPTARKLDRITYEEMLELAASGAKVLHLRCVEYARRYDMPIHVRSSFSRPRGHLDRGRRRPQRKETPWSSRSSPGSPHDRSEAKITVVGVPDQPGEAARDLRGRRRRRDQHRHDRAERVGRRDRPHRHLVHAARRPTARPRWPRSTRGKDDDRLRVAASTTTRSARSRWSAPACARTPASPRRSSARSPTPASTSR